jgi:hypothetical protein
MVRDGAIRHQMHHVQEDLNVFTIALLRIRNRCPFIHNYYDNPVVKFINQILSLDHK